MKKGYIFIYPVSGVTEVSDNSLPANTVAMKPHKTVSDSGSLDKMD